MKIVASMISCLFCLCCLLASPAPAFSAEKSAEAGKTEAPSATLSLEFGQGGFILSASGGQGTLRFKGKSHPFKIGSVGFGGLGVSKITATGEVYGLTRIEDFPGAYAQARMGYAAGEGKGVQWLKNARGVEIKLRTITKGVSLNLGADGLLIEMGKIRK